MGTGVGEAALLGAALGGGSAAISGGDPLKGALLGGITGGAGGALFGGTGAAGLAGAEEVAAMQAASGAAPAAASSMSSGLGGLAGAEEIAAMQAASNAAPGAASGISALAPNAVTPTAQSMATINASTVPPAGTPLGTGQTGDLVSKSLTGSMPQATSPFGNIDLGATDASLNAAGNQNLMASQIKAAATPSSPSPFRMLGKMYDLYKEQDTPTKVGIAGLGALGAAKYLNKPGSVPTPDVYDGPLSKFTYDPSTYTPYSYRPYAAGGPVEEMSNRNAIGANTGYPQSDIQQGAYATPWQTPVSRNVVAGAGDVGVDQMTGMERMAGGGIASLGGYSDGGRLLKGPGDGMSDNIPATIGRKQPARLADGEFVVPADVVSGLGNGSTDAGAKQLYKMLDKVRSARTGNKKQGKQINPNKYMPA
jgi:hypothetical protein